MSDKKDRSERAKERNLKTAFVEIDLIVSDLSLPDEARDTARSIYRNYIDQADIDEIEKIAAASLYVACRVGDSIISPEEFTESKEVEMDEKYLLRRSKKISSEVGLDWESFDSPMDYARRYCDELGLNEEIKNRTKEILDEAKEEGISSGKSPRSLAAAAMYNAIRGTGEAWHTGPTQSDIADVADITEVTIRSRYQEQKENLDTITWKTPGEREDTI